MRVFIFFSSVAEQRTKCECSLRISCRNGIACQVVVGQGKIYTRVVEIDKFLQTATNSIVKTRESEIYLTVSLGSGNYKVWKVWKAALRDVSTISYPDHLSFIASNWGSWRERTDWQLAMYGSAGVEGSFRMEPPPPPPQAWKNLFPVDRKNLTQKMCREKVSSPLSVQQQPSGWLARPDVPLFSGGVCHGVNKNREREREREKTVGGKVTHPLSIHHTVSVVLNWTANSWPNV